jgi:hypothetical protein
MWRALFDEHAEVWCSTHDVATGLETAKKQLVVVMGGRRVFAATVTTATTTTDHQQQPHRQFNVARDDSSGVCYIQSVGYGAQTVWREVPRVPSTGDVMDQGPATREWWWVGDGAGAVVGADTAGAGARSDVDGVADDTRSGIGTDPAGDSESRSDPGTDGGGGAGAGAGDAATAAVVAAADADAADAAGAGDAAGAADAADADDADNAASGGGVGFLNTLEPAVTRSAAVPTTNLTAPIMRWTRWDAKVSSTCTAPPAGHGGPHRWEFRLHGPQWVWDLVLERCPAAGEADVGPGGSSSSGGGDRSQLTVRHTTTTDQLSNNLRLGDTEWLSDPTKPNATSTSGGSDHHHHHHHHGLVLGGLLPRGSFHWVMMRSQWCGGHEFAAAPEEWQLLEPETAASAGLVGLGGSESSAAAVAAAAAAASASASSAAAATAAAASVAGSGGDRTGSGGRRTLTFALQPSPQQQLPVSYDYALFHGQPTWSPLRGDAVQARRVVRELAALTATRAVLCSNGHQVLDALLSLLAGGSGGGVDDGAVTGTSRACDVEVAEQLVDALGCLTMTDNPTKLYVLARKSCLSILLRLQQPGDAGASTVQEHHHPDQDHARDNDNEGQVPGDGMARVLEQALRVLL